MQRNMRHEVLEHDPYGGAPLDGEGTFTTRESDGLSFLCSTQLASSNRWNAPLPQINPTNIFETSLVLFLTFASSRLCGSFRVAGVGILITGCQAAETSADVTNKEGKSFGALSHTFQKVIRRHHSKHPNDPITYRQAVLKVRSLLASSGFTQHPCLECSEINADSPFLEH